MTDPNSRLSPLLRSVFIAALQRTYQGLMPLALLSFLAIWLGQFSVKAMMFLAIRILLISFAFDLAVVYWKRLHKRC